MNGVATHYFYDNEDILLEYDSSGNVGNRYIHGLGIDEPLALIQDKNTHYYHADGLGSIVALTDSSQKVVQEYEYDSFGNLHDMKNAVKQPYTFTGREYDRETGLYYYRARYYDAEAGRFTQKDPIGFKSGDVNFFKYAGDNPIRYGDPSGLYLYAGNVSYTSGGEGIGGGIMEVTLTSECYENKKLIGEYLIAFGGGTAGAPIGKSSFSITVDDHCSSGGPNLTRMTGYSGIVTVSAGIGYGVSSGILTMGEGDADLTGVFSGVDISADIFAGWSFLMEEKEECCTK